MPTPMPSPTPQPMGTATPTPEGDTFGQGLGKFARGVVDPFGIPSAAAGAAGSALSSMGDVASGFTGTPRSKPTTVPGVTTTSSGSEGPFDETIKKYAAEHGLENDPEFVRIVNAAIIAESKGNPNAEAHVPDQHDEDGNLTVRGEDSYGILQMNRRGGAGAKYSVDDLKNPEIQLENRVPVFAAIYKTVKARGKTGAELASEVSRRAQLPKDWENDSGAAAKGYISAYNALESPTVWENYKGTGAKGAPVNSAYARALLADSGASSFGDPKFANALVQDILDRVDDPAAAATLIAQMHTQLMDFEEKGLDREAANQRTASQVGAQMAQINEGRRQFNEKMPWEIAAVTGVQPNGQPTFAASEAEKAREERLRQEARLVQMQWVENMMKNAGGFAPMGSNYVSGFEPGGAIAQHAARNNIPFTPSQAPPIPSSDEVAQNTPLLQTLMKYGR